MERKLGNFSGGQLGSGTTITVLNERIILEPGADDIILLSQSGARLEITINIEETIVLSEAEASKLVIHGNATGVVPDETVTVPIPGLPAPPEKEKNPSSRSAGFRFRGRYHEWKLRTKLDENRKERKRPRKELKVFDITGPEKE